MSRAESVFDCPAGTFSAALGSMQTSTRNEYLTRDQLLKLLSDQEIASVSTAETAERLADGEEYLDLANLHAGIQKAGTAATPMGRVLPKKAVGQNTWAKLLKQLA